MKSAVVLAAVMAMSVGMGLAAGQVGPAAGLPAAAGAAAPGGAGPGGAGAGRGGAAGVIALNRAFYTTEFDTMNQQLKLTDDEKTKLQEKVDTMNKEIDQFLQGAQPQIQTARRGARGGAGARGAAGAGAGARGPGGAGGPAADGRGAGAAALAGNPMVLKLQDDLQTLINEHQVLINQALTPEQRVDWETYKLTRVLDPRWQNLGLTDDQKDKIKAMVDDTAKQLAALTDGKTVTELQGKLFRKIMADVLTDAQMGKMMSGTVPVQGGGRGAAGAGAPGAGGAAPAGG